MQLWTFNLLPRKCESPTALRSSIQFYTALFLVILGNDMGKQLANTHHCWSGNMQQSGTFRQVHQFITRTDPRNYSHPQAEHVSAGWWKKGFPYWIILIPSISGSIIYNPQTNHQPGFWTLLTWHRASSPCGLAVSSTSSNANGVGCCDIIPGTAAEKTKAQRTSVPVIIQDLPSGYD
jgi:hypothetical protein